MMTTKFDVGDIAYLPVSIGSIYVTNKGTVHYDISFFDRDGYICKARVKEKDLRKKDKKNGSSESGDKVPPTNI